MNRVFAFRFAFVSAALLLAAAPAFAALPPLTDEEKQEYSDSIVVGRVVSVRSWTERPEPGHVDARYRIVVQVERVEKGEWPRVGQQITLNEFQAQRRPQAWGGPVGQMNIPRNGARVRVFIQNDGNGGRETLEPNGIDTIR
jgi:hypothetical protein